MSALLTVLWQAAQVAWALVALMLAVCLIAALTEGTVRVVRGKR